VDARSLLRLTLRPGSVYYFQERFFTSPEPHYFIVVNQQPVAREVLVLTVISSKVEKVKRLRKELPGTTVEIGPGDYAELKQASVVDCNVVFRKALAELVEKIQRKEVTYKKDLPGEILDRIRQAIKASPLIEQETKRLL
jgi:hypothetical protein